MDLRTLRYFTVVAQERNITRAAEKLNMSQPPLSSQMRGLEEELGVTLFLRGKRRLELTEEGILLLRRANQILELTEKTRLELQERVNEVSGTLYLGMVEGRAPYLAAQWIAGFQQRYPLVRYNLWNGSSDDVLDRLGRGLADLAIIATPYDNERLGGIPVGGGALGGHPGQGQPPGTGGGGGDPTVPPGGAAPYRALPKIPSPGHPGLVSGNRGGGQHFV